MNVLSQLYYSTKYKFNNNEVSELEAECFSKYIEDIKNENFELKEENERLTDSCCNLTQENSLMDNRINELEEDLKDYRKIQDHQGEKLEHLFLYGKESDFYGTDDLDRKQISETLDKITNERNIYKEVINIMCDDLNISHDSILNIIDDIQVSKNQQQEKTL